MSSRRPRARLTIATLAVFAVISTAAVSSPAMAAPPPDKGKPSPTESATPSPPPEPTPEDPAPTPTDHTPPAPVEPTPVEPAPVEPPPAPAPVEPAPAPVEPAPVAPAPAPPTTQQQQLAPAVSAYPDVMAAAGDSITLAYNSASYGSFPQYSWSTGTASTLSSLRQRLQTASATTISGVNVAQVGANSASLAAQVTSAISAQADFLTVEIGANDACTPTVAQMTEPAVFRTRISAALKQFIDAKADNKLFVASIPNLYRMWDISKGKFGARLIWAAGKICQSMLANPTSTATADKNRRAEVQARVDAYNQILKEECAAPAMQARCTFDNFDVANYKFTSTHISTADYFHPSVAGQKVLASITWKYVPYPSGG
jgi:lysophospholipase L1-like esterase